MMVPTDALAELRRIHEHEPALLDGPLPEWGLTPLSGGRSNRVYRWDSPAGPVCLKLYRTDKRDRSGSEALALSHLERHGVDRVPRLLWHDDHDVLPAAALTLLPGALLEADAHLGRPWPALVEKLREMLNVPVGPFAELSRSESADHYIHRITRVWAPALREAEPGPLTRDLEAMLAVWEDAGDAHTLAAPAPRVFSHGDSNLLNWLWNEATGTIAVVDFEFAGYSDTAYEAAELVEHISMRHIDDDTLRALAVDIGVDGGHRERFLAAQRTCALRWLAVLWRQRGKRAEEFDVQRERVRLLQQAPFL
ncbi:aminoglycoside phosphotransferase family protein [Nocardiopsis tropica]|uniref:aminoglycoside phosphotransferase family protein n=1 Tax=Nocardiopsis tropica TaxID=109330 RepID=UPI002E84698E|nr:aminoglycoside phosphotransferase family protein [Nocardiopsis tropica]